MKKNHLHHLSRLPILFILFLSFTAPLLGQQSPNVVIVFADDIGYGDIAAYRRASSLKVVVETPALDELYNKGMSFTDGHSPAALCAPSRYCVMTGKNTYHSYAPLGVWSSYAKTGVTPDDATLGRVMKNAGYQTSFFGKWHLATDFGTKGAPNTVYRPSNSKDPDLTKILGNGPEDLGFEHSFMYPAGIQDVPYTIYEDEEWYKIKPSSTIVALSTDLETELGFEFDKGAGLGDSEWNPFEMGGLLVNKAVDFITNKTSYNQPFFLYYCTQAVHVPHTPADEINGIPIKGTTPSFHLDMVKEMDVQVSLLIQALKDKGEFHNTMFVFTSDNGGLVGQSLVGDSNKAGHNSVGKLSGGKNQIKEGGHRVPFMVCWPDRIASGSQYQGMASGVDLLSTLASLTNQTIPLNKAHDSFNLLPILLGDPCATERSIMMIQGGTDLSVAFREGDWKLTMRYENNDNNLKRQLRQQDLVVKGLYNLKNDLGEKNNLMNNGAQQTRIQNMRAQYIDIRYNRKPTKQINGSNASYTPNLGPIRYLINRSTADLIRPQNANANAILAMAPNAWQAEFTQWQVEETCVPGDYFYLKSKGTGTYMAQTNDENGATVHMSSTKNDRALWRMVPTSNDFFHLQNKETGKFVTPESTDDMEGQPEINSGYLWLQLRITP